jgi:hypothetical protein
VVESLLLALVSVVWLYLQTQKASLARDAVLEDIRRLSPILSGRHGSGEIILPRTEMFRQVENVVPSNSSAWLQFCQSLRVLDFVMVDSQEDKASLPTDDAVSSSDDAVDASLSQVRVRELLLQALRLDRRLRNDPQCPPVLTKRSRDQFLDQAVSIESSATVGESIAVRIKTMIHAVETAGAEMSDTDSTSQELAATLEAHLGRSMSSAAAWNLLGCLKASYDVDGALQSFIRSHELDSSRPGTNPSLSTADTSLFHASHSITDSHFSLHGCLRLF